ncbi:hypothetical protein ES703_103779 [subsurface metagenome]
MFYRRGEPENDGTITWSEDEQVAYDGTGTSDRYLYPCIAVDTNGYAWIGVYYDAGTIESPYVLKNANNDGTWTEDFAYQLNAADWGVSTRVCPVPLTDGKVYVVYCRSGAAPLGNLWNGAAWVGEETDLADYAIAGGYVFSAVALGDNVHFVYTKVSSYQIRHNERVWDVGWGTDDVLVQDAVTSSCGPALSVDPSTGDLYCFWTQNDTDHVYYKQYTGGAWGGLVDWIDESTDDIYYDMQISSFYMDYGGYIGLLYTTKLASPYNVRFAFLTMPPQPFSTQTRLIGTVIAPYSVQVRNIGTVIAPYSALVRLIGTVIASYSVQVRNIGIICPRVVAKCHAELSALRRRIF